MRSSYFNAFTQIRIEYSVCFTATAQIHFPPSALALSHTQSMSACAGRCLLSTFQYEHHNTLSCCHPFSCHKPTRASSFYSWMLGDTNHINFPTNWNVFMEGYIYRERKRERESWFALCNFEFCGNRSQYLTFATLHKWRSSWRPDLYLSPSFCFRLSYVLEYLIHWMQRYIETLPFLHRWKRVADHSAAGVAQVKLCLSSHVIPTHSTDTATSVRAECRGRFLSVLMSWYCWHKASCAVCLLSPFLCLSSSKPICSTFAIITCLPFLWHIRRQAPGALYPSLPSSF